MPFYGLLTGNSPPCVFFDKNIKLSLCVMKQTSKTNFTSTDELYRWLRCLVVFTDKVKRKNCT